MTTILALPSSASTMTCPKCGGVLISPEETYDFSEEWLVINLWSCVNCGNQFETDDKIVHAAGHKESEEEPPPGLLVA